LRLSELWQTVASTQRGLKNTERKPLGHLFIPLQKKRYLTRCLDPICLCAFESCTLNKVASHRE
jgi:hypothetical protein